MKSFDYETWLLREEVTMLRKREKRNGYKDLIAENLMVAIIDRLRFKYGKPSVYPGLIPFNSNPK